MCGEWGKECEKGRNFSFSGRPPSCFVHAYWAVCMVRVYLRSTRVPSTSHFFIATGVLVCGEV